MTLLDWILFGTAVYLSVLSIIIRRFVTSEFRRHGFEPVDYDAEQAEMDEEFAPIRKYEGA